jgi:hypothetical protein
MMGHMMEGSGWMFGFGWIFMILFWALIVLAVVALAKWTFSSARSEISREEYERLRHDLESLNLRRP